MKGIKTGGRVAGTPNVEKKELLEMLADKYPGYHPVLAMAEIANDKKNDLHFILHANKEVAKYVCPQLKSVELRDETKHNIKINVIRLLDGTEIAI